MMADVVETEPMGTTSGGPTATSAVPYGMHVHRVNTTDDNMTLKTFLVGFEDANSSLTTSTSNYSYYYNYDMETDAMVDAVNMIRRHYLKVLCAIGLPGNLAALLTIAEAMKPLTTATFLVALLAACDSVALVLKLVFNQLFLNLDPFNDHFCRSQILTHVFTTYANWVLVLVAVERLVAVLLPLSRNRVLSKRRVYAVCGLVFLIVSSIHAPLIVGDVAVRRFVCGTFDEGLQYYKENLWSWINTTVYAFVPMVLLLGINGALIYLLWKARRRRKQLQATVTSHSGSRADREARRMERAFTVMVLAIALLFVVMVLPQCFYYIIIHFTDAFEHLRYTVTDKIANISTTVLVDSTHALNFYMYVVSAKRFRRHFVAFFCRCLRRLGIRVPPPCTTTTGRYSANDSVFSSGSSSDGKTMRTRIDNEKNCQSTNASTTAV